MIQTSISPPVFDFARCVNQRRAIDTTTRREMRQTLKSGITEEYRYLPLVVGAHVQIAQNGLGSDFVIQLLVRRSVVS